MAKSNAARKIVLSPAARQDIRDILVWSIDRFGVSAAGRYRALLMQAFRDLGTDPLRPGSRTRPELHESARTYHLYFSRENIDGRRVKAPRHVIVYRISPAGLQVGRILHDSRELSLHLPEDYRA